MWQCTIHTKHLGWKRSKGTAFNSDVKCLFESRTVKKIIVSRSKQTNKQTNKQIVRNTQNLLMKTSVLINVGNVILDNFDSKGIFSSQNWDLVSFEKNLIVLSPRLAAFPRTCKGFICIISTYLPLLHHFNGISSEIIYWKLNFRCRAGVSCQTCWMTSLTNLCGSSSSTPDCFYFCICFLACLLCVLAFLLTFLLAC